MDPHELFHTSVARATGDDLNTITARGFQPVEACEEPFNDYDDRPPLMIDWDAHRPRSPRSPYPPVRRAA